MFFVLTSVRFFSVFLRIVVEAARAKDLQFLIRVIVVQTSGSKHVQILKKVKRHHKCFLNIVLYL